MIIILTSIIFTLCLFVIYIYINAFRQEKNFKNRINALEEVIVEINKKQIKQINQLKLSDDLNKNLKISKTILIKDIFNLNYDLFELLSKNNLLKK